MNTVGTLLLRAESNGGFQLDDGGFALLQASFSNSVGDGGQITVSTLDLLSNRQQSTVYTPVPVLNGEDLPPVRHEARSDVLSESDRSVSINRNI
jgi:hypothetical protein